MGKKICQESPQIFSNGVKFTTTPAPLPKSSKITTPATASTSTQNKGTFPPWLSQVIHSLAKPRRSRRYYQLGLAKLNNKWDELGKMGSTLFSANQKAPWKQETFWMDPERLALSSLCVNDNMLLYALRARVQFQYKTKRTLLQGILFATHNFSP